MTMLRNDEIQTAIVAYLKTKTAITSLLITEDNPTGLVEIREDQWQGTEFDYPNIRVRMIGNSPFGDERLVKVAAEAEEWMAEVKAHTGGHRDAGR